MHDAERLESRLVKGNRSIEILDGYEDVVEQKFTSFISRLIGNRSVPTPCTNPPSATLVGFLLRSPCAACAFSSMGLRTRRSHCSGAFWDAIGEVSRDDA